MAWGWIHFQLTFIFGWTIPIWKFKMKKHLNKNRLILDAFQMMRVDKVIPKFSLSE